MQELEGSVAIVTGSARNIGRAIALDLAEGGAAVTVLTRTDVASVKAVAAEIESRGGRALALQADITKPEDAQRIVDETIKAFGRLDILVNNAGVRPEGPFETMSLEAWDEVLAVVLDGAFLCCQAALPHLERSGKGAIENHRQDLVPGFQAHGLERTFGPDARIVDQDVEPAERFDGFIHDALRILGLGDVRLER